MERRSTVASVYVGGQKETRMIYSCHLPYKQTHQSFLEPETLLQHLALNRQSGIYGLFYRKLVSDCIGTLQIQHFGKENVSLKIQLNMHT